MAEPPLKKQRPADGAKDERDQNNSRLFNNPRFSDLVIKFSNRKIHAHRFVLCDKSEYFDKLCGPESAVKVGSLSLRAVHTEVISAYSTTKQENAGEIILRDDDPDAADAMLRHLYNFWLQPSPLLLDAGKSIFFCDVVVVSEKYRLPGLAKEAVEGLSTLVAGLDPNFTVQSLEMITDRYGSYSLLDECADNLAKKHLDKLTAVPEFTKWLTTRPNLLQSLLQDAAKFKGATMVRRYRCALCTKQIITEAQSQPVCCKNMTKYLGLAYHE